MAVATKATGKTTPKAKAPLKASANVSSKIILKPATKTLTKTAIKPTTVAKPTVKKMPAKTLTTNIVTKLAAKTLIEKPIKPKKIKLIRDSFTIPKPEYLILDNLKLRAADLKHPVKKSELLRAGIKALAAMTDTQLLFALKAVPMLKTGRPSK
jgi:hypothetical protein